MPDPQQTTQTTSPTTSNISDDVLKKFSALAPDKRRAALGKMSDPTKQALLTQLKTRRAPKMPKAAAAPQAGVTPLTAPASKGSGWLTQPGGVGRKIEAGLEEGATDAFGLKIPDPNRPSSLTWKSIAGQIIGGLGHQAAESLKQFGPLAPLDIVAKGMEGMAEGVESGVKRTVKGVAHGDPEEIARGVLGGGASAGLGMSGMEEAGKIANKISNLPNVPLKTVLSMSKMQDFMDKYVHARGLDLKETYGKAVKNVNDEIERHAKALQNAIPKDAIDATKELADANQALDDVVKTPEKYPPVLSQIAQSIKNHPPGKWDFETAKQFRTNISAAMKRSVGPMNAALTRTYVSVTKAMENAAKKIPGGKFSWDFYNELTKKFHQNFSDHVEDILGADSGHKVGGALLRDPSLAREAISSLAKYGLDSKKALDFIKHSQDIVKVKKFLGNSVLRYIYGTAAGGATMFAGKAAGLGWAGAAAPAVMAGLTAFYLKNLRILMELDPSIIDKVEKARALPGPQKVKTQPSAPGATPQTAAPAGTPPVIPQPQASPAAPAAAATPKIRPLTAAEKLALRQQRAGAAGTVAGPGAQASTTGTPSAPSSPASYSAVPKTAMELEREALLAKAGKELVSNLGEVKKIEAEAKASPKEPPVTKVPEGVHGDPQEALREKWRERKAATRQQSVRTEVKGAEEKAIGGGPASAKEFDELPSVDIEKDLSGDSPEGKTLVTALRKLKKAEGWDDDVYRGHLLEMAKGYAKRMAKRKTN